MLHVFYKPKIVAGDKIVMEFNISFLVCSFVLKIVNSEHFLKNCLGHFDENIKYSLRIVKGTTHKGHHEMSVFTEVLQLIS